MTKGAPLKVCFVYNDSPRERLLAEAVVAGCKAHGDKAWMVSKVADPEQILKQDADVYGMAGVKSRRIYEAVRRRSAHCLMFDKGYSRHVTPGPGPRCWQYWRVAVDAQHPTHYLMLPPAHLQQYGQVMVPHYPHDRAEAVFERCAPWREKGKQVVIAGSSEKYHNFYGLPHPTQWAQITVNRLIKVTGRERDGGRPIIYRPKPSWDAAIPVEGSEFSHRPERRLTHDLSGAWCLVTHGSNAALDAIMLGIPCIVTGEGIGAPISSTDLSEANTPRLASDAERQAWLNAVAYAQFERGEMTSGLMWAVLRPRILA